MFKACIKMRLKAELNDDWIMVAVDVSIYSIKSLKKLADKSRKCFREGDAFY